MTHTEMQQQIKQLQTLVDTLTKNHNETITRLTQQLDKKDLEIDELDAHIINLYKILKTKIDKAG